MATMVMIAGRQKRDDRGRYMEDERMYRHNEGAESRHWTEPPISPYLERKMTGAGMEGGAYRMRDKNVVNIRDYQDRRKIGFMPNHKEDEEWEDTNPYGEEPEVYRRQREERRNEGRDQRMMHNGQERQKNRKQMEHREMMHMEDDQEMMELDKQTAMEWVENMEDKSGVKGGAYTWHQAQQYGRNMGITGEKRLIEFYAVMNAMQSDYCSVAKKFGVDRPEFYAALAKCFIEDPDAVEDKVAKYYECIAKK